MWGDNAASRLPGFAGCSFCRPTAAGTRKGTSVMKFDFGKVKNYVGGDWVESTGRESFDVTNPATGEKLGSVPVGTAADVDAAVAAAKEAFATWRRRPRRRPRPLPLRPPQLMEKHFDELCALCTQEHGKTLEESEGRRPARHRQRRDRRRHAVADDGAGPRADRDGHRLRRASASRWASSRPSRRTTSRRWCRSGSSPTRSRPATRSS